MLYFGYRSPEGTLSVDGFWLDIIYDKVTFDGLGKDEAVDFATKKILDHSRTIRYVTYNPILMASIEPTEANIDLLAFYNAAGETIRLSRCPWLADLLKRSPTEFFASVDDIDDLKEDS